MLNRSFLRTMVDDPHPKSRHRWFRRILWCGFFLLLLVILSVVIWLRGALYNRFIRFPREEAAWQAIRAARQPVTNTAGWLEFRGIMHSHSRLSHDSEVPLESILEVLKTDDLDFICLSDHCTNGRADFSVQWRGLRDGKLFVPGFEMRDGFMPFGVASEIVLSNSMDNATLARQIAGNGGLLFFAHPEESRDWDLPELVGMEIYNIHVDFKRRQNALSFLLPELLINQRKYPEHVVRELFQRPVEFLRHWDELNRTRHITGIAGNDCHQNVGFRGFYLPSDRVRIEDTSPRTLKELQLNWFTRFLATRFFGPLEPGRKLFHIQLDPYERMALYVNTHVLARVLSEPAVLEALRAGRVFIGFDLIADSSSFRWFALDNDQRAVMGEALPFSTVTRLHALSPEPCRFTVLKDSNQVSQQEGRSFEFTPSGPGKYRVEAELNVAGEWVPWVYANPIELR